MAGKPLRIDDATRAAAVALYDQLKSKERVQRELGIGRERLDRILLDAGVETKRSGFRFSPDEEQRLRERLTPLWTTGATHAEMTALIGMPYMSGSSLRRLMRGIPRRKHLRSTANAVQELTDDEDAWKWFAGVFESRGIVSRRNSGAISQLVVNHQNEGFVQAIRDTVGVGSAGPAAGQRSYRWTLARRATIREVLRRIEPHTRHNRRQIRRWIEELEPDEGDDRPASGQTFPAH